MNYGIRGCLQQIRFSGWFPQVLLSDIYPLNIRDIIIRIFIPIIVATALRDKIAVLGSVQSERKSLQGAYHWPSRFWSIDSKGPGYLSASWRAINIRIIIADIYRINIR